jgi:hypothetical protein
MGAAAPGGAEWVGESEDWERREWKVATYVADRCS